ncbi:hypothetical protein HHI36_019084 [Cryptolaemus montrouzieri]|uniref:Uncharacterized protein n=1 Tax=Cryptolaemus montrouzieri TaxID=559131 RepID=A0ABD2P2E4_9CUCU
MLLHSDLDKISALGRSTTFSSHCVFILNLSNSIIFLLSVPHNFPYLPLMYHELYQREESKKRRNKSNYFSKIYTSCQADIFSKLLQNKLVLVGSLFQFHIYTPGLYKCPYHNQ